jgi:hypothetical protein
MTAPTALLVRPHDFLVDSIRAWMLELELTPVAFSALDDFKSHRPENVRCIVISTAASSRVKATVREAVDAARRFAPRAPLILPSLAPLERVRAGLALELKGLTLRVESPEAKVDWGAPGLALNLWPAWLEPARRAELNRVTRLHLGLAPR